MAVSTFLPSASFINITGIFYLRFFFLVPLHSLIASHWCEIPFLLQRFSQIQAYPFSLAL